MAEQCCDPLGYEAAVSGETSRLMCPSSLSSMPSSLCLHFLLLISQLPTVTFPPEDLNPHNLTRVNGWRSHFCNCFSLSRGHSHVYSKAQWVFLFAKGIKEQTWKGNLHARKDFKKSRIVGCPWKVAYMMSRGWCRIEDGTAGQVGILIVFYSGKFDKT